METETGLFWALLFLYPVLLLFYRRFPSRVMCGPVLDSTRCGFFNLRWELKEVAIGGCFACLFFES